MHDDCFQRGVWSEMVGVEVGSMILAHDIMANGDYWSAVQDMIGTRLSLAAVLFLRNSLFMAAPDKVE